LVEGGGDINNEIRSVYEKPDMELLARRLGYYIIVGTRKEGKYKNAIKYKMKCLFI